MRCLTLELRGAIKDQGKDADARGASRLERFVGHWPGEDDMHFDDMNELQRRLHNAAIVAESDGDEWGHAGVMRDAIAEIERLRDALKDAADTAKYACLNDGDVSIVVKDVSVGTNRIANRPEPNQALARAARKKQPANGLITKQGKGR